MIEPQPTWLRLLPFGLLAIATAVATATNPAFGDDAVDLVSLLGLAALAGAWMGAFTFSLPDTARNRQTMFIGRTALAFVLSWWNPFFAIFALAGFIDSFEHLEGRRAYAGMVATAATMAGSQSGGLPPDDGMQWAVFGALLVLNGGLSLAFTQMGRRVEATSEERAETIEHLERLNAELEAALAENAELHQAIRDQARRTGIQEERQRLAREIHDTIAQGLAGIIAQLQASHDEFDPARREAMIRRATEVARTSLTDARRSVLDLGPASLDEEILPDALAGVVSEWTIDHDARVDLAVTGDHRPMHPEVETTLLRITQEALANTAKHADASRVRVTLTYLDDDVLLDVRDDGRGFPSDVPQGQGFGLHGMRQRVERLAGDLRVESSPGGGAVVSVRLPALDHSAA